jgi:hypothetical protein
MEKIKKYKEIFWMSKGNPILWKDIKHIEFEDDDIITAMYDEQDKSFFIYITRYVE